MFSASSMEAAHIITSVDYQINTYSAQRAKIGDTIYFTLAVINSIQTYNNVTVVSTSASQVVVGCPDFPLPFPTTLFVYDGTHTWRIDAVPGYQPTNYQLTLNNSNLIAGSSVSDYTSLQYADFTAARGSPPALTGSATIDIGTAITGGISIFDDGDIVNHNDATPGDGVYNGKFLVREAYQFNVENGAVVGHFLTSGGVAASNDGFIAPNSLSMDAVRPSVELVNANPNPYNPNTDLLQVYYYLTENCSVTLEIRNYAGTITNTVKTLTAAGSFGYNTPILWDGLSNSGVLQGDGLFYYRFNITDAAGNTGTPYEAPIRLTSIQILMDIHSINTEYIYGSAPQTVVTIVMKAHLINATQANLANLGFDYFFDSNLVPTEVPGVSHDYRNYPYLYLDLKLYNSSGALFHVMPRDTAGEFDSDDYYADFSYPKFADGLDMYGYVPRTQNTLPADLCNTNSTTVYSAGDWDEENDWDNVFLSPFIDGVYNDGVFDLAQSYSLYSSSMQAGTYIASLRGVLVGKTIARRYNSTYGNYIWEDVVECPSGNTTNPVDTWTIHYYRNHVVPSFFYDEDLKAVGDCRGYGLASDPATSSFIVSQDPSIPVPDSIPPAVISYSEYPSDGTVIEPNVVGPSNPVKVMLTDNGVGAGATNLSTFILRDPYGNQVPGYVAWNAGTPNTQTWELYYIPDSIIVLGGTYTITIVPVDASFNIGNPVEYSFTVADTTIPVVTAVSVHSSSGGTTTLSPSTSEEVSFLVSRIEVTMIPGGSALVDWNNSSITVLDGSGSSVSGTISHTDGTNILMFTPDAALSDGNYTVNITAESENGYSGGYSYSFYITTTGIVYINLSGTGLNTTTCMIAQIAPPGTNTGMIDNDGAGTMVTPTALSVTTVASPQTPPASYNVLGSAIAFSIDPLYNLPVTINPAYCSATLRINFTSTQVATLASLGLDEDDLTLWEYDGSTSSWSAVSGASSPVSAGGGNYYIEAQLTRIPDGNQYALMYVIPATGGPTSYTEDASFQIPKAFNPNTGPARIFFYNKDGIYLSTIAQASTIEVKVYSLTGKLVRSILYPDTPANFGDANWAGLLNIAYFDWDGLNDNGTRVRNGIYIMKIIVTETTGTQKTHSRLIAVIK